MRKRIGSNDPCPCNSGKKYKKCCGDPLRPRQHIGPIPEEVLQILQRREAEIAIREQQQGLGNPIVSTEFQGYRVVGVGGTLHWSKSWKTFPDFLLYYIKKALGNAWGNEELGKSFEERHPILQWYQNVCDVQQQGWKGPGEIATSPMNGAVHAYLNLAYHLYLLAHNTINSQFSTVVQQKLVADLKRLESFPGALYECYVFSAFIRAGFEIEFEDQSGKLGKRCECVVTHKLSGRKYTVEAKAIRRMGALGASANVTSKPLEGSIRNQLYDALSKASEHPRIVFIELNLPAIEEGSSFPDECARAVAGAEEMTVNKGSATSPAYVVLTNVPHHYHLNEQLIGLHAIELGYKLDDFGHGKQYTGIRAMYHAKKRHSDIYEVLESLHTHYSIPSTFDGTLPSETFDGSRSRVLIGQRYFFESLEQEASVTSASVDVTSKTLYAGTDTGHVMTRSLTDSEMADYLNHPDTYFGARTSNNVRGASSPLEFFEWLLQSYKNTPKETLLGFLEGHPHAEHLKTLSQAELAEIYCEGVAQWRFKNEPA